MRRGLLGHIVILLLITLGSSVIFSIMALPIDSLTSSVQEFPFLHTLAYISNKGKWYLIYLTVVLIHISLLVSGVKEPFHMTVSYFMAF